MYEESLQKRIDTYILPDYFVPEKDEYRLMEAAESGRTELNVILENATEGTCICIECYDMKQRCEFLARLNGMRKCVDHVVLTKNDHGMWDVHLIEMKKTDNRSKWIDIKQKVRASILNIRALASVLGIEIHDYKVYTTYEKVDFRSSAEENPAERRRLLGSPVLSEQMEWDNNQIAINFLEASLTCYAHQGIQMQREIRDGMETLCGALTIA